MIKNLLDADDTDSLKIEPIIEIENPEESFDKEFIESPPIATAFETENSSEKSEASDEATKPWQPFASKIEPSNVETPVVETNEKSMPEPEVDSIGATNFDLPFETKQENKPETTNSFLNSNYQPETSGETIRKSGLAYSAAIILFASIVFMLMLGWFADLLLGSSPWGIVGGIALGSIIGFTQFFRITSQIINNKD